ncbi:hypothetical protein BACCELL_03576 [Bacteroides cellulosilyticus DSM 14838]|uniref:Uncharacterized protein n=1 Tax=Bacteroides cellulosilyticus DSM 14838 TaxID=537012 RepID=E2NH01_9BACE|nr:hypothetical protein BACCELL_03576 [Bacteroides cellulosilyticus DSM 14838]
MRKVTDFYTDYTFLRCLFDVDFHHRGHRVSLSFLSSINEGSLLVIRGIKTL